MTQDKKHIIAIQQGYPTGLQTIVIKNDHIGERISFAEETKIKQKHKKEIQENEQKHKKEIYITISKTTLPAHYQCPETVPLHWNTIITL